MLAGPMLARFKKAFISKPGAGNFITAILTWLFSSYAIAPDKIYQCQDCLYESQTLPVYDVENN